MLRLPLPFLGLAFAAAIVAASHAPMGGCDGAGQPALGIVEVTTGLAQYTFYVDDRNWVLGNGLWLYQEANGVWTHQGAGIHRGDVTDHNLQRGSNCGGELPDLWPRSATATSTPAVPGGPSSECQIPDDSEICWDGVWEHDRMLF